jgi:transglutaminase-like putative cysteine protease
VLHGEYKDSIQDHDTANATALLLNTGKGVCDSYTRAYRLMLCIAGIENRFVAGVANGDNHCWNLVRLDGAWVHVDCTYSDPKPDAQGRIYHTHFALTDRMIASDHEWNRSLYPAATSTALYYPYRHRAFETMYDLVAWAHRQNNDTPVLYITAYVNELRVAGSNDSTARRLIEEAHEDVNAHVIAYYALEKCLPGVICVKVKD